MTETLAIGYPTIIMPTLHKKLTQLEFRMSNAEDLTSGIQPFLFGQHSPEQRQDAQKQAELYDLILNSAAAPSLSDSKAMIKPEGTMIPLTLSQEKGIFIRTNVATHVYFGTTHPLAVAMSDFVTELALREVQLETCTLADGSPGLG